MNDITQTISEWMDRLGPAPRGKAARASFGDQVIGCGRELDGRFWLRREYYVPESHDDDDLSTTGFALPPRMGSTRRVVEIHDDSFGGLADRIAEIL